MSNFANDSNLRTEIDVHDLQVALEEQGPEFQDKVRRYLADSLIQIKAKQDAGVTPDEFQTLEKLKASIENADRVIQIFSKKQSLA